MENVILIKVVENPDFENVSNNILIKNIKDGKLYIGNDTGIVDEVKTDKSNNWAKMFFYGGN
jgi:hypothetical protein